MLKRKMMKMIVVDFIVASLISAATFFGDILDYGVRMGVGQLKIMLNTSPVEKWLGDPSVPDSVKTKIRLVEDIRHFCFDSLGLKRNKSYTRIYDQKGLPLMWVVTGSEKYRLNPYLWKFPIVGKVSYKGFFNPEDAAEERDALRSQGFDARIREVNAWSTLGYFRDPILSEMLYLSEGALANVIIHELSHGTIYISGDVEESENLASFIGDVGAEAFLMARFGRNSPELLAYKASETDYKKLTEHMLRGSRRLDSLYTSPTFIQWPEPHKSESKTELIRTIIHDLDTLHFEGRKRTFTKKNPRELPDNSLFIEFRQYNNKQEKYEEEFLRYSGDLKSFIQDLKKKYES